MEIESTVEQVLAEMMNQINGLDNEVIQLRNENQQKDEEICEIKDQLVNTSGPSMMTGNELFMATLKAFFEQKELKVQIPEPHNWEGDWKGLNTFKRECETWLADQKVTDQGKAVTLIVGYMKGLAAQWYMINQKARELAKEPRISMSDSWKEVKRRFRDSDPNFTAWTRLEKLKQGQKPVHMYNSIFNEYAGLTGYNEIALVNAYYGGLNDDILHKILNKENVPLDLDGTQGAAIKIKNLEQQLEQFTSDWRWEALIAKNIMKPTVPAFKPTTTTPIAQLSPLARTTGPMNLDQAWKEGLCRYCSEQYMPGHLCTAKQRAQDAYKAWSWVVDALHDAAKEIRRSMELVKGRNGK